MFVDQPTNFQYFFRSAAIPGDNSPDGNRTIRRIHSVRFPSERPQDKPGNNPAVTSVNARRNDSFFSFFSFQSAIGNRRVCTNRIRSTVVNNFVKFKNRFRRPTPSKSVYKFEHIYVLQNPTTASTGRFRQATYRSFDRGRKWISECRFTFLPLKR